MKIRPRCLPAGWYPLDKSGTQKSIESMKKTLSVGKRPVVAGIVPHAGWEFSGRAALEVFLSVETAPDTCVIIGGHLTPESGVFAAPEDAYETPFGPVQADLDLLKEIQSALFVHEDNTPDNTVEIQLPFVAALFPKSKALWLRACPSQKAINLGEVLAEISAQTKKRLLVIGSTDLTHYGANYGFTPHGRGEKALEWVKTVNDKRLIDFLVTQDLSNAVADAIKHSSACSAGGAVAAASFAKARGASHGELISYYTSHDVMPHDSFVGYAGIVYTA